MVTGPKPSACYSWPQTQAYSTHTRAKHLHKPHGRVSAARAQTATRLGSVGATRCVSTRLQGKYISTAGGTASAVWMTFGYIRLRRASGILCPRAAIQMRSGLVGGRAIRWHLMRGQDAYICW